MERRRRGESRFDEREWDLDLGEDPRGLAAREREQVLHQFEREYE
jgi:hypothetical protein